MNKLKKIVLSNSFLTWIAIFFRRIYLKNKFGIRYQKKSFIGFSVKCGGKNGFGKNSIIVASKIGFGSYIADGAKLSKCEIGSYCSIGPNVNCIFGKHPSNTFVSTHPSFFSTTPPVDFTYVDKQCFEEYAPTNKQGYSIIIGNDVWIGANVSLMDGVKIGDGAIIAANALVTKDVEPYTIVGGVPAKLIKKRFSEDEIHFLLGIKWWERPESWIRENVHHFKDIKNFIQYSKNKEE